jgi:hypothetical protein
MNSNSKILIKLEEIEKRLDNLEKQPKLNKGMLEAMELYLVTGQNVFR